MTTSLNSATPGRDVGYQVEQILRKTIAYSDTSPVTVGGLPTNALVTGGQIAATTAFNAGSTATIALGYSDSTASNSTAYAGATSVAALSTTSFNLSGTAGLPLSRPTTVIATIATTGSAATAGSAEVLIRFVA